MEEAGKEMDATESRLFALRCLSDSCVDLAVCRGLRLCTGKNSRSFFSASDANSRGKKATIGSIGKRE